MKDKASFFNAQYGEDGGEAAALDHPLYKYLLPYAKTRVEVATAMLGDGKFEDVVELGVGTGAMLARNLDKFERYLGFDISEYQLSQVPVDPRVTLKQADLDAPVPCEDGRADLVISLSTIEYLRDPIAFLEEAHRVLRPQGTLLLHTMNVAFLPRRLQLLAGKLPTFNSASGWQGGVLHHFTFPTLERLLRDRGFLVEDTRCAGLAPSLRLWWKSALASDMLFRCRKVA